LVYKAIELVANKPTVCMLRLTQPPTLVKPGWEMCLKTTGRRLSLADWGGGVYSVSVGCWWERV